MINFEHFFFSVSFLSKILIFISFLLIFETLNPLQYIGFLSVITFIIFYNSKYLCIYHDHLKKVLGLYGRILQLYKMIPKFLCFLLKCIKCLHSFSQRPSYNMQDLDLLQYFHMTLYFNVDQISEIYFLIFSKEYHSQNLQHQS